MAEKLHLDDYTELIPVIAVGLLCGIIAYIQDKHTLTNKQIFIKSLYAGLTTCIVYGIVGLLDVQYLTRVCIAAGVGFFGIDDVLRMYHAFKNGGNNDTKHNTV